METLTSTWLRSAELRVTLLWKLILRPSSHDILSNSRIVSAWRGPFVSIEAVRRWREIYPSRIVTNRCMRLSWIAVARFCFYWFTKPRIILWWHAHTCRSNGHWIFYNLRFFAFMIFIFFMHKKNLTTYTFIFFCWSFINLDLLIYTSKFRFSGRNLRNWYQAK